MYVVKILFYTCLLFVVSCTLPEERQMKADAKAEEKTQLQSVDSNAAIQAAKEPPAPSKPKMKEPSGIYRVLLPYDGKMEQTIAFYNNNTYRLQEKYHVGSDKKDSVVIVEGNWTPSNDFIWLYKDQIVRGRYTWKGDILQYYSPVLKKAFPMEPAPDIMDNKVWRERESKGIMFYGIGNEPFWNVEVMGGDSMLFRLADWNEPIRMKLTSYSPGKDSTVYVATSDSSQLRLTIQPYFCSDGMSDFVYSTKIRVLHNGIAYHGCGVNYAKR